ncbi:hypothetical protein D3C76_1486430 [compost metagenome]
MIPALFSVARWPAEKGVRLPLAEVTTLLLSMLNTPLPLVLSPRTKLPSKSS